MSQATESENMVKACPQCGTPMLYSCHHSGTGDVRSVEMPIPQAIELMDRYVCYLNDQLEDAKEHRQQLVASMMDWQD